MWMGNGAEHSRLPHVPDPANATSQSDLRTYVVPRTQPDGWVVQAAGARSIPTLTAAARPTAPVAAACTAWDAAAAGDARASRLGCSMETIASREEAGLRLLHSRLVAGRYAQAPLVLDVPEMHGGIVYEETTTLIVVEQRRWRGTVEHYRLANMAGELDFVTISRSYPAHVTAQPGGEFSVNSRPVEGAGWNDHFWHIDPATGRRTPMQDATRYDLAFRAEPLPDEEPTTPISLASRAFHVRSLLATIQVRFIGEVPASIWQFTGASPFARPQAANQYNRTHLDAQHRATLTQRDVHGGLFGGFGWEW